MFRTLWLVRLTLLCCATGTASAVADAPRVVADIAPVHSLVAAVMGERGAPALLIPADRSPHEPALRPSAARVLEDADLVFWTSRELSPWLRARLEVLARKADTVELLQQPETLTLPLREGVSVDEHVHGAIDPHAWLDPINAQRWLRIIAKALAREDPAHGEHYAARAAQHAALIGQRIEHWQARLSPLRGRPFIVLHDSFQYFETRFALSAAAAVMSADASAAGAARIERLHDIIRRSQARCLFTEPQMSLRRIRLLVATPTLRTVELDSLGAALTPGASLYITLIDRMADAFTECLD